ncbi:MAG: DUF721 domain-containing protein [Candidatus Acidiferrales bacterium]
MDRAGTFLGRVVRRLDRPQAALAWLAAAWPQTVGASLAARTRPIRCHGGTLEIAVDGKPWQLELESMRSEFSARINQAWGSTLVREIKFVPAPRIPGAGSHRLPHETDNDHTPFIHGRKH